MIRQALTALRRHRPPPPLLRCSSQCPTRLFHLPNWKKFHCDLDVEPLEHYKKGGYHPVHLEDCLKDGRYKVVHKLGWGGHSTVWIARDQKRQQNVAVKIEVGKNSFQDRESSVLRTLASKQFDHPGYQHLMTMQDCFQLEGPNGTHNCLVLELLGPSVADCLDGYASSVRLPGGLAKEVARQALLGVSCLHAEEIAHGDLHIGNIAFTIPSTRTLGQEALLQKLGEPRREPVRHRNNKSIGPNMPRYLVQPAHYPKDNLLSYNSIKIIDFGQAFRSSDLPNAFHTPLVVRPPEIIFKDRVDYHMDLWSMGCLLFEIVTRQTPFDYFGSEPASLMGLIMDTLSDPLPSRWQAAWHTMKHECHNADKIMPTECTEPKYQIQQWLEEVYFDDLGEMEEPGTIDMSRKEIRHLGAIVESLLRYEPTERFSATSVLRDPWFAAVEGKSEGQVMRTIALA